jgi:predicted GH43/DUF377 family glycosyl hydrolase
MKINRFERNPIITPADVQPYHEGFEVIGAFNAGVAKLDNEYILLLRVAERPAVDGRIISAPVYSSETNQLTIETFDLQDEAFDFADTRMIRKKDELGGFHRLTSLSYLRIARSHDGYNFTIDPEPFIYPHNNYQHYGVEDARITQISDSYYITFSSVSEVGIAVSLIETRDFVTYEDKGIVFAPENKDVVIFPEKINGQYYALHRPSLKSVGNFDIWIAESPDLIHWGKHQHLVGIRPDSWDSGRIGAGLVPIKTEHGWLELYHGATPEHKYCMGALLLDLDDPTKVIARSQNPIMVPERDYEQKGFFGEVVFGCGGVVEDNRLIMYYGVSDTSMAVCEMEISDILAQLVG